LITRWGRYKIFPIVGFAMGTIALIGLSQLTADTPFWQYEATLLLLGLGFGNTTQVLVLAAQNAVEPRDIGVATSTATFMRQMGGTFGAAIFGTVLAGTLTAGLRDAFPQGPPAGVDAASLTGSPAVIAALPDAVRSDVVEAFVAAIQATFLAAIPATVLAFVLALFLREVRLKERAPADAGAPGDPGVGADAETRDSDPDQASTRSGTA
jgi:MFS family permease